MKNILYTILLLCAISFTNVLFSQTTIRGDILDGGNKDPIIGANVVIKGFETEGTITDWDGSFEFSTNKSLPLTLLVSYVGYVSKEVELTENSRLQIVLQEDAIILDDVTVTGSRILDKQKESPLTIESMDIIAIKETPAADFYDGLGALKGVDLTAASIGFKVVNTRGFNSTSPVRSLQIIDGVDNQAPGLNFSLGNFLGTSELDIKKVELVVGASSAFYGPNAFNGVISMETKDPFFQQGLSAMVKVAERNMLKGAIRWADAFQNKAGKDYIAYKFNLEYLQADDWEAENYDPVDESRVNSLNPGRFDAVNIYGDEYQTRNDFSSGSISTPEFAGLGTWYRTGYREIDLVDYDTRNLKANAAIHWRTNPDDGLLSPELIFSNSFGSGTTVYQGDNRFSLRNITFLQNKLEFRKLNKYFIRAYTTRTSAGDSYDPYFTALELQKRAKEDDEWSINYNDYWVSNINSQMLENGYPVPQLVLDPTTGLPIFNSDGTLQTTFDVEGARKWLEDNRDLLVQWHGEAEDFANGPGTGSSLSLPFFAPGTDRFQEAFDEISGTLRTEGGTKFFDNSALYHVHGEYIFTPSWTNKITVGANARLYTPESRGTVFSDSTGTISNFEFGTYAGIEKSVLNNKVKLQAALRADKNENFDWLFSPAMSIVYTPSKESFFRVSFSSAIRNPTLTDQYLFLDVGRAILSGNLNGVNDLVTVESVDDWRTDLDLSRLDTFSIAPVRPEKVQTLEVGFRTTLFNSLYVDAGYYYSTYQDFIGFNIGIDLDLDLTAGTPRIQNIQAYRYSANSTNTVTTQGLSIGMNYYFAEKYTLTGNYSWNQLVVADEDDPIIPAFNTPEHKFNIGLGGRNFRIGGLKNLGFNINYKWIEGFLFEGSPQFTGFIPTYDMLDAQVNIRFSDINTTLKIGASNLLDNRRFQTFGGPRIGRLAYATITYEPKR